MDKGLVGGRLVAPWTTELEKCTWRGIAMLRVCTLGGATGTLRDSTLGGTAGMLHGGTLGGVADTLRDCMRVSY